jgi:hypothetical protein
MRRIYFLLPDVQSGKSIIDELLLKRVEWRHIHVLARPDVRRLRSAATSFPRLRAAPPRVA